MIKKILFKLLNIFFSERKILQIYRIFKPSILEENYKKGYFQELGNLSSWKLVPMGVRLFQTPKNKVINSNNVGFRTHEFELNNNKVIIVLGGSASWGLGASSDEKTFSSILEKKLKKKNDKWTVFNLSMMAATSQQELLYLIFWGLKLNPEIVISFSGFNDLTLPNKFFDKENNIFILPDVLKYKKNFENIFSINNSLIKKLILSLNKPLEGIDVNKNELEIDFKTRSNVFLNSNKLISDILKNYDTKYYTVMQPTGYNKKKTSTEQKQFDFYTNLHASRVEYTQGYRFAKENGLYNYIINKKDPKFFLNYENLFDNESRDVFVDGIVHLNDYGHEMIANKIFEDLVFD